MSHRFLVHEPGDTVGVAVADIKSGEHVTGTYLHDHLPVIAVTARRDIPLGHKIALASVPAGKPVLKYGVVIGEASAAIEAGDHVHVQNLKSLRWKR